MAPTSPTRPPPFSSESLLPSPYPRLYFVIPTPLFRAVVSPRTMLADASGIYPPKVTIAIGCRRVICDASNLLLLTSMPARKNGSESPLGVTEERVVPSETSVALLEAPQRGFMLHLSKYRCAARSLWCFRFPLFVFMRLPCFITRSSFYEADQRQKPPPDSIALATLPPPLCTMEANAASAERSTARSGRSADDQPAPSHAAIPER